MNQNSVSQLRSRVEREFAPRPASAPAPEQSLAECRQALIGVTLLSAVINMLYLTSSFFMLEVYDRVIPSRSLPTLAALCVIALVVYGFQGVLDLIRGRVFVRMGALLDARLSDRAYRAGLDLALRRRAGDPQQPSRDLDQLRQFLWSGGPVGFLDLPWIPVYLLICFAFHPWIGAAAMAGAAVLVVLTLMTDRGARQATQASNAHAMRRSLAAEASRRSAEAIHVLGMRQAMGERWHAANSAYLETSGRASDVVAGYGAFSKVFRTALQSMVLALGAWLVIRQEATGGIIIAASILVSRALAPVEAVIGHWKGFVAASSAWRRLDATLGAEPMAAMALPAPCRTLAVENLMLAPPGAETASVVDVSFVLQAGTALGVIGRSASGKSSLVRALVGIWPAAKGAVRLDGAAIAQWPSEILGPHLGYMPQESELFAGTIAENIARFAKDAPAEAVIAAARAAGIHDLVLRLPNGYDTVIGEAGTMLSAGQRQRVALARALYGDPFLVVLDEPNSNLDQEGDLALTQAIEGIKARGGIAVVVAHRPAAVAACDLLLMMAGGRAQAFGPRDEVLAAVTGRPEPASRPASDQRRLAV
ncbi:type I secretion system permease/ATPase [Bosea sp. (in: a-proteobacteria)]|uniref:type I secretion system permease/ATPase n=1 Tax=Bosea sp. (in: a-proteobacteria) TaxID=1871050 RepID=UPI003B3B040D